MKKNVVYRRVAQALCLLEALLLASLAVGLHLNGEPFSRGDKFEIAFLVMLVPGLVLSLFREKAGILLAYAGVACFFFYDVLTSGVKPSSFALLLGALPPTLLLYCRLADE